MAKIELMLMDYRSDKHPILVEEGATVTINILSGDHVMVTPEKFDCGDFVGGRIESYFDGTVCFKATKENAEKLKAMKDTYDLWELDE